MKKDCRHHSIKYASVPDVPMTGKQQGAAGIIAVIFLLVVVTVMLQVITNRAGTNLVDASMSNVVGQAHFLAESGIERALWTYRKTSTSCAGNGLGEVGFEIVAGTGNLVTIESFKTDTLGNPLTSGRCRLKTTVSMTNFGVTHIMNPIVSGNVLVDDPFLNISDWTTSGPSGDTFFTDCAETVSVTAEVNDGTVAWDAVETATADGSGSLNVTTPTGRGARQMGYRTYTSVKSAPAGAAMEIWLDYKKIKAGAAPTNFMMAVDLVATDGTVHRAWCDSQVASTNGWVNVTAFPWVVPAGKTINTVRLSYDILNKGTGNPKASNLWFDNLKVLFN